MRVLLDECVPAPLAALLAEHECATARQMGWHAVRNGDLLTLAETAFEAFITADQNIRYQQNLAERRIAILELSTNNLRRIESAAELIRQALRDLTRAEYRRLEIP